MTISIAMRCELVAADPRWWDCPQLDTVEHLSASLGDPLELPEHLDEVLINGWATDHESALLRWFAWLTHSTYDHVLRNNTYNSDNDLSSNFVFSVFAPVDCADWHWAQDVFVVVETHLGGDVRGNYGAARVYRVDSIAESGFLEWVCGWFATPINSNAAHFRLDCEHPELTAANDRLGVGWSSHPTSELRNLLWGGCEPVWSERLNCYVARLADVPFAVRVEPVAPHYG